MANWREIRKSTNRGLARIDRAAAEKSRKRSEVTNLISSSVSLFDKWATGRKEHKALEEFGKSEGLTYDKETKSFYGIQDIDEGKEQHYKISPAELEIMQSFQKYTDENISDFITTKDGNIKKGYAAEGGPPVPKASLGGLALSKTGNLWSKFTSAISTDGAKVSGGGTGVKTGVSQIPENPYSYEKMLEGAGSGRVISAPIKPKITRQADEYEMDWKGKVATSAGKVISQGGKVLQGLSDVGKGMFTDPIKDIYTGIKTIPSDIIKKDGSQEIASDVKKDFGQKFKDFGQSIKDQSKVITSARKFIGQGGKTLMGFDKSTEEYQGDGTDWDAVNQDWKNLGTNVNQWFNKMISDDSSDTRNQYSYYQEENEEDGR